MELRMKRPGFKSWLSCSLPTGSGAWGETLLVSRAVFSMTKWEQ